MESSIGSSRRLLDSGDAGRGCESGMEKSSSGSDSSSAVGAGIGGCSDSAAGTGTGTGGDGCSDAATGEVGGVRGVYSSSDAYMRTGIELDDISANKYIIPYISECVSV